jgi:hypothetical protein
MAEFVSQSSLCQPTTPHTSLAVILLYINAIITRIPFCDGFEHCILGHLQSEACISDQEKSAWPMRFAQEPPPPLTTRPLRSSPLIRQERRLTGLLVGLRQTELWYWESLISGTRVILMRQRRLNPWSLTHSTLLPYFGASSTFHHHSTARNGCRMSAQEQPDLEKHSDCVARP